MFFSIFSSQPIWEDYQFDFHTFICLNWRNKPPTGCPWIQDCHRGDWAVLRKTAGNTLRPGERQGVKLHPTFFIPFCHVPMNSLKNTCLPILVALGTGYVMLCGTLLISTFCCSSYVLLLQPDKAELVGYYFHVSSFCWLIFVRSIFVAIPSRFSRLHNWKTVFRETT